MLTRDQILAVTPDLATEEVAVPEWGGTVFVRMMTAGERDRYENAVAASKNDNIRARLALMCVCDDKGKRLFSDGDLGALAGQPAAVIVRLWDAAVRVNQFLRADVEGLEKNSESGPSPDSS